MENGNQELEDNSQPAYKCMHKDEDMGKECGKPAYAVTYPADEEEKIFYYCIDHLHEKGFCCRCLHFMSGIGDFDFDKSGLCSDCKDELANGLGDFDEEDDFYMPGPYAS